MEEGKEFMKDNYRLMENGTIQGRFIKGGELANKGNYWRIKEGK